MTGTPRIQVIVGSTREGRFGERAAAWVNDRLPDACLALTTRL